jgi:hypothetical protein
MQIPKVCRECGESSGLTWFADVVNRGGCQDGRIKLNEVQPIFYLGCEYCSETMLIVDAGEIAHVVNTIGLEQVSALIFNRESSDD